ncbi:energy-coupling factor transporter transmembrane component T [Senegalimassilia faecalis]|uniref:energy-coupling factor transporter transmembrane component T family protein n=1 Tax=Senegalimassilia faecalis TaxID=2509433 RepID=UPI00307875C3
MNAGFSFGSYIPGQSCVHRLDPRTKLVLGCVFIVVLLCSQSVMTLAICAAFVAAAYGLAQIPPSKAVASVAPLMAIVVIVALLNLFVTQGGEVLVDLGFLRISEAGVYTCLFMGARLTIMMLGMSLITLTTMTIDLTEAFERLFSPFARFGLPAHELGMIMGIALRFMPQFANELVTVYHAQVSRGAKLSNSPVKGVRMLSSLMVPLFTSVFRHAETLSAAMDARCYHGGEGRTHLHPLHFAPRDGVAAAAVALLACCVAALNVLL